MHYKVANKQERNTRKIIFHKHIKTYTCLLVMIHYTHIVRNHVHREQVSKISNIFDISNLKESFLSSINWKRVVHKNIDKIQIKSISKKTRRQVNNELNETEIYKFNNKPNEKTQNKQHNSSNHTSNHKLEPQQFILNRRHRDQLFWNLYILHHGYDEYLKIDIHYGNTSISERQRACEYISKNVNLKTMNHKITKASIEEALSELICPEKKTSYYALCALCAFYKMKIIIIHPEKKYYIDFYNTVSYDKTHILEITQQGYKILCEDASEKDIEQVIHNKIKYEHFTKPLKGMSAYKVDDLRKMAQKLNIDHQKNKQELYNSIYKYIG